SAEMERRFSHGGLMVSPRRQKLKGPSVHTGVVLSSWHDITDLVPEKELMAMSND
ncbi:hypothetical protein BT96DRAFT_797705, partial [Gymnopus androsaceus JB14]